MENIDCVLYINLEKRKDRRTHVEKELESLGIPKQKIERYKAIENKNGAIGCTLSHIMCLKIAIQRGLKNVMIVEDDICFTDKEFFRSSFPKIFNYSFDVFMLGVNLFDYEPIDETMIRVLGAGTTTGYIVQSHYFETLLSNYKQGLELLLKTNDKSQYCIDSYTIRTLQHIDRWMTFKNLTVTQVYDYSDIESRNVSYDVYMLKDIETMPIIKYRLNQPPLVSLQDKTILNEKYQEPVIKYRLNK